MTIEHIDAITTKFRISRIPSADHSVDLRYGVYQTGSAQPERYVVFLNGRNEWLEKYAYVAADLDLGPSTRFLTFDHRGQGASGGARAHVDHYATYVSDTLNIIDEIVGNKPYVLMAHSMGALISLFGTLTGKLAPQAIVLGSPLLGLPRMPIPRPLAKPLSKFLTLCGLGAVSSNPAGFEVEPFAENVLTHNAELYRRIVATPYHIPGPTFGWVSASFAAVEACFTPRLLQGFKVPTLVLAGSAERVVDPEGAHRWVALAAAHAKAEIRLEVYEGARHELLSEIPSYYNAAIQAVRIWFSKHAPGWNASA